MNQSLQQAVLDVLANNHGPSVTEIEDYLRARKISFGRDELRSVIWRLASGERLVITPESRIVLKQKP